MSSLGLKWSHHEIEIQSMNSIYFKILKFQHSLVNHVFQTQGKVPHAQSMVLTQFNDIFLAKLQIFCQCFSVYLSMYQK